MKPEPGVNGHNSAVEPRPQDSFRAFGMAPENVAEADIPTLRGKEKEKKGAGVPAFTGSGPGSTISFNLGGQAAQVGAGLSPQMGFLGSGRIAAALVNLFGGPGTFLGGIFASQFGAPLVLAGMLAWAGLLAGAGLVLMSNWKLKPQGLGSSVFLPAVGDSGIMLDKPKDRMGLVANANKGELNWTEEHPLAPKEVSKDAPKEAPKPEAPPQPQMPDVSKLLAGQKQDLNATRNTFISQLTKDVSQLNGGGSFLGGKKLQDGTAGFQLTKTFANASAPAKLQGFKRQLSPLGVRNLPTLRSQSGRAVGQLNFANTLSKAGQYTADDVAKRSFSTDAFDGQVTPSGNNGALGLGNMAMPPGSGSTGLGTPPDAGTPVNQTPYQPNVDQARNQGDNSGALKAAGVALIIAGLMLIAAGIPLLGNPTTAPIGAAMIAAGTALLMMGIMLIAMGAMMAQQAKNQAQNVGQNYGQPMQQQNATNCVNSAFNQGVSTSQACPQQSGPVLGGPDPGGTPSVPVDVNAESPTNPVNQPKLGGPG